MNRPKHKYSVQKILILAQHPTPQMLLKAHWFSRIYRGLGGLICIPQVTHSVSAGHFLKGAAPFCHQGHPCARGIGGKRLFFFITEVRGTCRKQFCLFWLPRAVDFKVSCSQIPRRAFTGIHTTPCLHRDSNPRPSGWVRRPNHSATTLWRERPGYPLNFVRALNEATKEKMAWVSGWVLTERMQHFIYWLRMKNYRSH
jgi:hypothetical protein